MLVLLDQLKQESDNDVLVPGLEQLLVLKEEVLESKVSLLPECEPFLLPVLLKLCLELVKESPCSLSLVELLLH